MRTIRNIAGRGWYSRCSTISGLHNPFSGRLGVVEEGELADLPLADGNPPENIRLVAEYLVRAQIYKDALFR